MKNILVSGGAGFIGSNFVRYVLGRERQVEVISLDALTYAGSLENLRDLQDTARYTFINGNICDRGLVEKLFDKFAVDTVVHFAAETHVDRSIVDAYPFIQTNVVGTFILLDVARQRWIQSENLVHKRARFHHISTDEVYGSLKSDEPPFSEDHPYQPNSPYASSKAASDHLVRAYAHTYGLPVSITNCSNNYGPFQFPEKLIPLTILNALEGKPLPLYGDGNQIRDWLYVEDHCNAIWQVLKKGRVGETYNIGGNNQITNLELVRQICRILDEEFPNSPYRPHENLIAFVQDRPGHDYRYAMDISKIRSEVGWQPEETLSSGLRRTVKWYLHQQEWVHEIQKRPSYREWLEENYASRGEVA